MDDAQFDRWFMAWKGTRPDTSPLGWYDIHELAAAFAAGKRTEFDQAIRDIIARSQQLQALLSDERPLELTVTDGPNTPQSVHDLACGILYGGSADERPGSPPPAGPLP